ncbi:flagellar protein FlaI [Methanomicrobium sp. W14]|uniref:ATPase, T2SS/T4P/T4SS family n=1 Tax=Methanomicrobium sp. W14 TaxID=2817839 RepID=UPI001AE662B7|nr:ATPase, T2SS/T4P/T4SS family [Methanomicrobium sp. W14]MBP2133596.1 flagellar protein FlaI [Methanomicrobium sp. W14]
MAFFRKKKKQEQNAQDIDLDELQNNSSEQKNNSPGDRQAKESDIKGISSDLNSGVSHISHTENPDAKDAANEDAKGNSGSFNNDYNSAGEKNYGEKDTQIKTETVNTETTKPETQGESVFSAGEKVHEKNGEREDISDNTVQPEDLKNSAELPEKEPDDVDNPEKNSIKPLENEKNTGGPAEKESTGAGHKKAKKSRARDNVKTDSGENSDKLQKNLFSAFFTRNTEPVKLYNFRRDGPLVKITVPEGYSHVKDYWISEGRSCVLIAQNNDTHLNEYFLFEPLLSEFEYELLERLFEDMRDVLILTDEETKKDKAQIILEKTAELLKEYKVKPEEKSLFMLQYYLKRNFLGWAKLDPLINDPYIEDISCDGSLVPVFLYHRKYRNIKTNVLFSEENLNSLAITLAQRAGKHISISQPMLDATLPDGSRLQLTLGKEITTRGTSFTIRKFREDPFTPVELMEYKTFSAEELVYFWLAIENNKSLLFVGGTASGKTSSLNAVALFIPPLSKVVSIEDTREITLYHDNWIASVTRESVAESTGSKIDMFDLLKAAMRQRPEYIIVGEVRGEEAQTLFQAMNTGHTTFSTLHANNVDASIHRLENAPLNVPRNMVQALDVVSVQALVYRGQERVRRSREIVEIAGIDPGTGNLRVNNVFEYDPISDTHSYSGRSDVYRSIMEVRGWSSAEMNLEIENRMKVLNAMHEQGIRDYVNVTRVIQAYSINPGKVMSVIDNLKSVVP